MISLNGKWETGLDRQYDRESNVPGLVYSALRSIEGKLWYKKELTLPNGDWTRATLLLLGARYMPRVYINGNLVSSAEGGLTVTRHYLDSPDVKPDQTVTLEIELTSFKDTPSTDASKLPEADIWRSDLSSHIWNDVYLELHKDIRIDSVITAYEKETDSLDIRYKTTAFAPSAGEKLRFTLLDGETEILHAEAEVKGTGRCTLPLLGKCKLWRPENPTLYTIVAEAKGATLTQKVGIKSLERDYPKFKLNGNPVTLRAASICWHRWQRDEQAVEIAYDHEWFREHIVLPLKKIGANTLRFHLGPPPEKFLDLCDEYGLLVQAEWSFFHGLEASAESLREQWANWLDMTLRHVSIAIVHPWNEIFECKKLADARDTLKELVKEYPDFLLAHRDVLHIHKYWWSMFENLGLYYDKAEQFPMPVMADEFGGNYLDYDYSIGKYPELVPSFRRFLGENNTAEDRKWLQKASHARVAEYWRRLGVAGFSPFCMISSPDDGNTYFEGNLKDGKFKPVFAALSAAYAPVSVSMEVWDRNFYPASSMSIPLHLFNDTNEEQTLICTYGIEGKAPTGELCETLEANSKKVINVTYEIPKERGEYTLYAATGEVVSRWDILVTAPHAEKVRRVGVLPEEAELISFLETNKIPFTHTLEDAEIIVGLHATYESLKKDATLKPRFEAALTRGCSVALLGAGPMLLGEGYESDSIDRIQQVRRVNISELESADIAFDLSVSFKGMSEPESCVQPTENYEDLLANIDRKSLWLWNGLRGGLILPAVDMAVIGKDKESFEKLWKTKGANLELMKKGDYFAYELEGYYRYSTTEDKNGDVKTPLRNYVKFIVDDAPSLEGVINTEGEILCHNLHEIYESLPSKAGKINYVDFLKAGKNLVRTPAVIVESEEYRGRLFVSQLITDGRLATASDGVYTLRRDPAAAQLVINLIQTF